jgi:hypothetical protein
MPVSDHFKPRPHRRELFALLNKILTYQKSLADARAVELEELEREGVLSPADLEFMQAHSIAYTPHRRTDRSARDMLSLPTAEGKIEVGPSGPPPENRVVFMRDFRTVTENFLRLTAQVKKPDPDGLKVRFTERDWMNISAQAIMILLSNPQWTSRLATIQEVATELGLELLARNRALAEGVERSERPRPLNYRAFLDQNRTAGAVVAILGRGFGCDEASEISYSASALDEQGDNHIGNWTNIAGTESRSVDPRFVKILTFSHRISSPQ